MFSNITATIANYLNSSKSITSFLKYIIIIFFGDFLSIIYFDRKSVDAVGGSYGMSETLEERERICVDGKLRGGGQQSRWEMGPANFKTF